MREIKFREWDPNRQEMYGSVGLSYGVREDDDDSILFRFAHTERIDGDLSKDRVLEQYTGIKDRGGVEIYEGDIVCQQMRFGETNGVIFWQEEKARFAINLDGFITTITKPQEMSYEVVGNIHENPELLEETK